MWIRLANYLTDLMALALDFRDSKSNSFLKQYYNISIHWYIMVISI